MRIFSRFKRDEGISPEAQKLKILITDLFAGLRASGPSGHTVVCKRFADVFLKQGFTFEEVHAAVSLAYTDTADGFRHTALLMQELEAGGFPPPPQPVGPTTKQTAVDVPAAQPSFVNAAPLAAPVATPPAPPAPRTMPAPPQRMTDSLSVEENLPLAEKLHQGSLFSETVAAGAFSVILLGDRQTGTSTALRAFVGAAITGALAGRRPIIDIVDFHHGVSDIGWQGLEKSDAVTRIDLDNSQDDDQLLALAARIQAVCKEIRVRRESAVATPAVKIPSYVFACDGWDVYGDYYRGSSAAPVKKINKDLLFLLKEGPKAGVTVILTARNHKRVIPDHAALAATRLLAFGRMTMEGQGGYAAIDHILEDKEMVPSKLDRNQYAQLVHQLKQNGEPLVMTLTGGIRISKLPDISPHLGRDLQTERMRLPSF